MEIVDTHQHIGSLADALGDFEAWEDQRTPQEEIQGRIGAMDAIGVSWAVIQPAHSYQKADGIRATMRINDGIAAYRSQAPDRLRMAVGTVEPAHGERSLEEIDRCRHELGLNGLSWHHRLQGMFIDNKWMRPYLKRMGELGMAPIIHTNAESKMESPWRLQKLAFEFPELTFLAMDAFYSYEQSMEVFFIAEHTPNIIWDLGGPSGFGAAKRWIKRHGSEKFSFSAGLAYAATASARRPELLDAILGSDLSDDDKANILGRNVRRLFNLPPEG